MVRPNWRTVALVVGGTLLLGPAATWYVGQTPSADADPAPVTSTAARRVHPEPAGPMPTETGPIPEARADPVADPPAAEAGGDEDPGAPTRLAIPAIGVDAPVNPVGLLSDGSMEVPGDVASIGWYEPGILPGASGSAVLAGHVDSREQGRGAFFDLRLVDPGDAITVEHDDGGTTTWEVTERRSYPKDVLPIDDIFTRFSETRLVLITCGGAFDRDTRHYTQNVVVYAHPVHADEPAP